MNTIKDLKICTYSNTIRLMPYNYWVATITPTGLLFDSWDGMTKELFNAGSITKEQITEFYNKNKTNGTN